MKLLSLILLLAGTLSLPAADWRTYRDPALGFALTYPAHLRPSARFEGPGREFASPDGRFTVSATGGLLKSGDPLETYWKKALKEFGASVHYKKRGRSWFVISGIDPQGMEFYYKVHVRGPRWAGLTVVYPHSGAATYNPWVEYIEDHFRPWGS